MTVLIKQLSAQRKNHKQSKSTKSCVGHSSISGEGLRMLDNFRRS